MNGKFSTQLNWAERFLIELNILEERILYPYKPDDPLSVYRRLDYEMTWKYCLSNQVYNLQLTDASIVQINFNNNDHYSFAYYECPYDAVSYKEFLLTIIGTTFNDVGDSFQDEYDIYLSQCGIKDAPMMIRYDYDPINYNEGIHPASHLHFGYNSTIRIGIIKKLDPQSFILLILRQCYPNIWCQVIIMNTPLVNSKILSGYINSLEEIEQIFLNNCDKYEFYLH